MNVRLGIDPYLLSISKFVNSYTKVFGTSFNGIPACHIPIKRAITLHSSHFCFPWSEQASAFI